MKLYYFETPNARKPCAVAKYLDIPVEYVRIDVATGANKTAEFLAINPNGKVPALTDGHVRLWEGHALMAYLAQHAGSDLWPHDTRKQVDVLRWLNWDTAHFSRHGGTLYFENCVKQMFGIGPPNHALVEEAAGFFRRFAAVLDEHLEGRRYLLGDDLSIADFGVACMLPYAREGGIPLSEFESVARWHDRLMEIPAWREPYPAVDVA